MQLGHVLTVHSERESLFTLGFLTNKPLLGAVAIAIAFQLAIIYVPVLNRLFHTQPLAAFELGLSIAAAAAVFGAVEIEKWVRRTRN